MSDLYDLPNGWEWAKLKDVCDLLNGYAFKAKEYVEHSETVIIRMGNIRPNGGFDAEHKIKYLPNKYKDELPNYILNDGDLVIAMTDLASEMRILGNPTLVSNTNGRTFMLNQRVGKLHKFDYDKIVVEYLRYILSATQIKDYYKSLGGGGLQINIGKQQILSVEFPLPPLSEQQRIVSKLDNLFEKIDKAIALHVKNMDEADLFMGSVLNDVFGELEEKYEKKQLKDIVDNFDGKRIPIKSSDRESMSGEYPYYGASGIIDYVNDYIFDGEYLLISEDGANLEVRKYPIAFIANGKFWVNNHAHIVSAKEDISTNKYMEYVFAYTDISDFITGSAQPKMSQKKMNLIEFVIPPLNIQQKVVKYLDEISKKIEKVKRVQKEKMDSLKALKASILDRAFRGGL